MGVGGVDEQPPRRAGARVGGVRGDRATREAQREPEVGDDLRREQADQICVARKARIHPLEDSRRHGGAAEDVSALEHEHRAPGPREIRGGGQSIVAAADDDDVEIARQLGHAAQYRLPRWRSLPPDRWAPPRMRRDGKLIAMSVLATDWSTISSLATGAGTLVLAVATFASVRSSNRSARIAEVALQEQRRPVLVQSRLDDPVQKLMFVEGLWVSAAGGRAVARHEDGNVYLAISLRNVGSGIGVCQGWAVRAEIGTSRAAPTHADENQFRPHTRDLYVPAGDIGMWQGALRNPDDPVRAAVVEAIEERRPVSVELLYSDQIGAQRTITRFGIIPTGDTWLASVTRHWYLDWDGPRPEREVLAAMDLIVGEREASDRAHEGAVQ